MRDQRTCTNMRMAHASASASPDAKPWSSFILKNSEMTSSLLFHGCHLIGNVEEGEEILPLDNLEDATPLLLYKK